MKLVELINELSETFEIKHPTLTDGDFTLFPKHLKLFKQQLLDCDEFKSCELEILKLPNISDGSHRYDSSALLMTNNVKLYGKAYVYNISLTPEMYNPNELFSRMEKDVAITPVIYSPDDFKPQKFIILKLNPEEMQDMSASKFINPETHAHVLLHKALNNPDEYRIKPTRGVIVRGIFESIGYIDGTEGQNMFVDDRILDKYVIK